MFSFLTADGNLHLDATNWPSENGIPSAMVIRKTWGGHRTGNGARIQSIITSVWRTASQHGHDAVALPADRTPSTRPRPRHPPRVTRPMPSPFQALFHRAPKGAKQVASMERPTTGDRMVQEHRCCSDPEGEMISSKPWGSVQDYSVLHSPRDPPLWSNKISGWSRRPR